MGKTSERLRAWAKSLKAEIAALWFAIRDPATPWYARALGLLIVGYALSPIDLIPDFIPVLGYLDDLILLPLGLALLRRLLPAEVMERARARVAAEHAERRPQSRLAAFVIGFLWLAALGLFVALVVLPRLPPPALPR